MPAHPNPTVPGPTGRSSPSFTSPTDRSSPASPSSPRLPNPTTNPPSPLAPPRPLPHQPAGWESKSLSRETRHVVFSREREFPRRRNRSSFFAPHLLHHSYSTTPTCCNRSTTAAPTATDKNNDQKAMAATNSPSLLMHYYLNTQRGGGRGQWGNLRSYVCRQRTYQAIRINRHACSNGRRQQQAAHCRQARKNKTCQRLKLSPRYPSHVPEQFAGPDSQSNYLQEPRAQNDICFCTQIDEARNSLARSPFAQFVKQNT